MAAYKSPSEQTLEELRDCANRMRIHSVEITAEAKSGHPTSSTSAAEVMSTLFFHEMKYEPQNPRDPNSDRFVMSKGHACPILYAAWHETGLLSKDEIMALRRIDSDIEGHPTPRLSFIDVATGSLGQGLSCAAGMAWTSKNVDKASYRVYCLIGDGESAEGSIWEACAFASNQKLDNLVAIFDINRLGQSQATAMGHDIEAYRKRLEGFGWHPVVVDGHDVDALLKAYHEARQTKGKPTAIVAKTFKGKGLENVEDRDNWHGKPVSLDTVAKLREQIKYSTPMKLQAEQAPVKDAGDSKIPFGSIKLSQPPAYKLGEKVATRLAYGTALAKLGHGCSRVVAFDCDTKNSTFADKFMKEFPERFAECFIAEQNMVGVAVGASTRGRTVPFCSTFATFFTRAADQLRMAAVSFANIKCAGSHVGVSIGEDGPSQMGLEDIALFRCLPGATVFYPSDAVSAERSVELAANIRGIVFIRTGRPATPVLYANDEKFESGKAKVLRQADGDKAVIIGAGVTLYEALEAADSLKKKGVGVTVIDPFTIKPLDAELIKGAAKKAEGRVVVVEDHHYEGGIGEAVSAALSEEGGIRIRRLGVEGVPRSGKAEELMDMFEISAKHVEKAVLDLIG